MCSLKHRLNFPGDYTNATLFCQVIISTSVIPCDINLKHIISGEWVHIDNRLSSCIQSDYAELIIKKQPSQVSFIEAIREDDIIIVKALIAAGADVNAKDKSGETPLHIAAVRGYQEITALLIDKGADLNAKNNAGVTPLQVALQRGHQSIVELLRKF